MQANETVAKSMLNATKVIKSSLIVIFIFVLGDGIFE